ncbi:MAG TPA: pilus assembly protein TadG-related protein [candidate division Zixibacteria bacterium]|nr:pilus assembly protein TadG-related protein [candidate division Zixibacteria bacterium]
MVTRAPAQRERGQIIVIVALVMVILLAFTGVAIDVGRYNAEERHLQTAADAAALAACHALIDGETDMAAAALARTVAEINLQDSPVGGAWSIASDGAPEYADGHAGDPGYLTSGILIAGNSVRVAIASTVETTLARVVGVPTLQAGGRARCQLQGGPALPIVARRYENAPGPGSGFRDFLATEATSTSGAVDQFSVLGYGGRTPASEAEPGPIFELYGPGAKASNESSFRGFVALDVRDFEDLHSRDYYNGATAGTSENTLKNKEGAYLLAGYPGPGFPPVTDPADPKLQVAALLGNDSAMVVGNFRDAFQVGDRILLAVYNGTVMQIPDFALSPPTAIEVPSTTTSPVNGPNFQVTRNDAFNSTVTLHLHGDEQAADIGHPEWDLVPDPAVSPPAAGDMNEPTWSTNVFIPARNGTTVSMRGIQTNAIPAGIYTVWLEGHSGDPYFQTRRVPVSVKVGGATRDFSLANSTTRAAIASMGGSAVLPIFVSTTNASGTKWSNGTVNNPVTLSIDEDSFTDCSLDPATIGPGQLTLDQTTLTPSSSGSGAQANLTVSSVGLTPGCYRFNLRAYGINGDGQPVVHIQPITFTVATTSSDGVYVDIIGFAVFQVTDITANSIFGRAVTGAYADPNDLALRRAQVARLMPW